MPLSTESWAQEILRTGTPTGARAETDDSGAYRFEAYRIGIGRYVRVCTALDAVFEQPIHTATYRVHVRHRQLPGRFRHRRRAIAAAVAEAKAQGII